MFQKQTFEDNLYMKLFRWVYLLLMGNLCLTFILLPFFLAVVCLAIDVHNLPLFALSLLSVGPGMMALMALCDQFKTQQDLEPVKDFFHYLRCYAERGFLYGLIGWLGAVIGITDMVFFTRFSAGKWLIPFFALIVILGLGVSLNCWYFQVRNPLASKKDVLRIASYYVLRKWYISLLNVILFALIFILMLVKPQFGFVVTPVLFVGLIYLNCGKLH